MKIYLFKNFNNYYNREITTFNTINEYIENDILKYNYAVRSTGESIDSTENGKRVNFAEHDGLRTELTYNYDPNQDWVPSYVIVGDIESRWFVIDYYKNRKGQYKLYLKRDTISDFKRLLVNSKAYIERASYLSNPYPLIYNKDNDSFNEIKQNEYLLTDDTKLNWYVIYLADNTVKDITISSNVNSYYIKASYTSLDDVPYYTDIVTEGKDVVIKDISDDVDKIWIDNYLFYYNQSTRIFTTKATLSLPQDICKKLNTMTPNDKLNFITILNTSSTINGIVPVYTTLETYNSQNDRNIMVGNDYYSEVLNYTQKEGDKMSYSSNADLVELISKYYKTSNVQSQRTFYYVNVTLDKLPNAKYTTSITAGLKYISKLPYKALVIPCLNRFVKNTITKHSVNNKTLDYNFEFNNLLINNLVTQLKGSNFIYDIQLFPYCPIQHTVVDDTIIFNGILNENVDYIAIKDNSTNYDYTYLLALQNSNFSFNIANTFIEDKGLMTNKELKIEHQCDSYRLCAPDNSSIYNLDILANGGVDYFNVDCTLKPYASYIHINPNFKYLNGIDTDDYRGLVIKSDFAIPMVSNNWETYVQNNVNYQKIFDRQIQNMDVNNKIANDQAIASIITGAVQGASTGGFIGNSLGGKGGALIGGAVSGVASAVGGYYDLQYQKQLQQENKSYATDTFNLNLGNIKAQANTLSKVDSFDYNNKLFPYIEFYSCTDQEKEYYRNKIEVSGYNIDVITDDISKWYNDYDGLYANKYTDLQMNYLKCRLIKIDYNMTTDVLTNNIINDLAEELNKGVYI